MCLTVATREFTRVFSGYAIDLSPFVQWSPDGTRLVFSYQGEGSEDEQNVYTVAADGSALRQITDDDSYDFAPVWSLRNDQIAFVSDQNSSPDIFIMAGNGRQVQNLTNSSGVESSPVWSPDGEWIAYLSDATSEWDVYVMRADGSEPTALGVNQQMLPIWSPDGESLLLYGSGEALFIRRDGSEQRAVLPGQEIVAPPAWKPQ